jgi:hypothetical protein
MNQPQVLDPQQLPGAFAGIQWHHLAAGEGTEEDGHEAEKARRPMNAVGLVTAEKVKMRAASAAHTAFEAWQVGCCTP